MLGDVGRRAQTVDGKPRAWQPNAVTLQVLANTIATDLPSFDAVRLTDAFSTDPFTPLADLEVDDLSPPGAAAYHLLAGDAPSDVDANVAAVTQAMAPLLDGLSPSTAAPGVRTAVYLLHDRNDGFCRSPSRAPSTPRSPNWASRTATPSSASSSTSRCARTWASGRCSPTWRVYMAS